MKNPSENHSQYDPVIIPLSTNRVSLNQGDYKQEFIGAMHREGIAFRDELIPSGTIQRFSTGKKNQKDGWYVFYGMAGAFGDWSKDLHRKWSVKDESLSFTTTENLRLQIEQAKRISDEEKGRKHQERSAFALSQWNTYSETGTSSYLLKKKVEAFGVRFHKSAMVLPFKDTAGKLWSLQFINSDGKKRFLSGGRKKGCFHQIGTLVNGKPIIITEGYATGASVYMATYQTTVIAFDAGNLEPVIEALRKNYPASPFIIAGDDDCCKEHNIGRQKA
ncbi:MAG: hypothetical protein HOK20_03800 [Alphaproteobacteria bacterium]|nr:hypothetical protein [Alphaproteobacteria bacterium]